MKTTLLSIALFFNYISFSQTVTNVDSHQEGNNIVITYKLTGCTPQQTSEIFIYYALNDERFIGPLKSVTGDIGNKLFTSGDKKVIWDVTKELGGIDGNVKFKIETIPGQKVSLPSATSGNFKCDILKTERKGTDLYVSLKITNTGEDENIRFSGDRCKTIDKNGNIILCKSFINSGKSYTTEDFMLVKDIPLSFTLIFSNIDMSFEAISLLQIEYLHKYSWFLN